MSIAEAVIENTHVQWPARYNVLGVNVSATDYNGALDAIFSAASQKQSAVVSLHPVHAIIESGNDPELMAKVNRFQIVAPDGQPVRWALNRLHGLNLDDRVYGPELTLRICERAAKENVPVYFYGASESTVAALCEKLTDRFDGLNIVGSESPPFRPLTATEDAAMISRINESGAAIVFIGLGCPKQDHFAADHADSIQAVQVCVGAAFDFHAGNKKMAPAWMQKRGLEWLFRLVQEPGRLWKRYLVTNTTFVYRYAKQAIRKKFSRTHQPTSSES